MNITFLQNKKILNLGLRWHILRSYHFVAEVTFKAPERRRAGGEAHCSTIFATIQKRNVKYVIGKLFTCKLYLETINSIVSF